MSDLESFKQMFYSKPMLSTALCGKLYSQETTFRTDEAGRSTEAMTHNEEYVVLINSKHQQVQQLCNQAFDRVQRLLQEGKTFRVTVSRFARSCFLRSTDTQFFVLT